MFLCQTIPVRFHLSVIQPIFTSLSFMILCKLVLPKVGNVGIIARVAQYNKKINKFFAIF